MIQVIPINDIHPHTEDTTCICCPQVKFEEGEMIVVHHSFDGRENIEEGGMEPMEKFPEPANPTKEESDALRALIDWAWKKKL